MMEADSAQNATRERSSAKLEEIVSHPQAT